MRLAKYLALLAGVVSTVAAFGELDLVDDDDFLEGNDTIEARGNHCARGVHVIALGGQGTTQGDLGYLATLADNIRNSIPDSTLQQIGYPAGMLGPQAIPWAMPKLRHHIKHFAHKCPHTKIVLASYSVGAAVTMNTLCGSAQTGTDPMPLRKSYIHHILANVVYGDLTFLPGRPYNRGTCKKHPGLVPREHPHLCHPYGLHTASYCDHGDVNCCSGHNQAVHFEYPEKYDGKALQFVLNRWHRFKRNEHEHHHKKHHHHRHHKGHKKHHHKGHKKHHHKGHKKHHHKGHKKHHHKGHDKHHHH